MEARSLASLNALAANPPQYPARPTDERREPLVLYISRVPGTRDVILSPFKPQVENVTAEDVAASLYYIHLELPSSDLANAALSNTSEGPYSARDSSTTRQTIPRKPLPDSARPLTPESLPKEENPTLSSHSALSQAETAEVTTELPNATAQIAPSDSSQVKHARALPKLQMSVPPRKPLPSGATTPVASSDVHESLSPSTRQSPTTTTQHFDTILQHQQQQQQQQQQHQHPPLQQNSSHSLWPRRRCRGLSSAGSAYTLTLIRRDPGSGAQWNVGRVSSKQVAMQTTEDPETGSAATSQLSSSFANPPIDIEIETSGYAKFRRMPARTSAEVSIEALLAAASEDTASGREIGVFSRQVVMSYSKSWSSNVKERLQRLEQAGRARMKQHLGEGTASAESSSSEGDAEDGQSMKARGYTFTSPWHGKCEFRTAGCGRIVRCKQSLHDGGPAAFNPLVADQGNAGANRSGAATISELRFNLPTSEILSEQTKNVKEQWRGNFGKLLRPADETAGDAAVSPFEVNIGAERAGGGIRGSRAKLGKLIVFDDGLKMLDLVVAANMGVWWGAWERMF